MRRAVWLVGGVSLGAYIWLPQNASQYQELVEYSAFYTIEGDALELEHP